MVKIEFCLSLDVFEKLQELKDESGSGGTYNDYAEKLLTDKINILYRKQKSLNKH